AAPHTVVSWERKERAVRKWVQLAEDFVALEIVNYVSQFFVQLRNLVMFLTIGPLLLMLAVTSYPFQPQRLLLLFIWLLIGILVVAAVVIFMQIERDELVSRISRTTPHRLSLHWGFFSN